MSWRILHTEMWRLTSNGEWLMSSNIRRAQQGFPISNAKNPTDPGVAVYFKINGRPVSLACDKWILVEDNMYALAMHIEALRGQDRWGVGTIEQAFRGYMALPGVGESSGSKWWETLGVPINADVEAVKKAYRILVNKHHPDKPTGDREMFHRVQTAYEEFNRTHQS